MHIYIYIHTHTKAYTHTHTHIYIPACKHCAQDARSTPPHSCTHCAHHQGCNLMGNRDFCRIHEDVFWVSHSRRLRSSCETEPCMYVCVYVYVCIREMYFGSATRVACGACVRGNPVCMSVCMCMYVSERCILGEPLALLVWEGALYVCIRVCMYQCMYVFVHVCVLIHTRRDLRW